MAGLVKSGRIDRLQFELKKIELDVRSDTHTVIDRSCNCCRCAPQWDFRIDDVPDMGDAFTSAVYDCVENENRRAGRERGP